MRLAKVIETHEHGDFNRGNYSPSEDASSKEGCVSPLCKAARSTRYTNENDPNGIRTRVTAVKGRCPGPLDDRVTKPANIGIAIAARKANCRLNFECADMSPCLKGRHVAALQTAYRSQFFDPSS